MSNIDLVLSKLDRVKPQGRDKWLSCCPAHDDNSPSLSVSVINDRVLFKCWAGCGGVDIMRATGLDMSCFAPEGTFNKIESVFARPKRTVNDDILTVANSDRSSGRRLTKEEKQKELQAYLKSRR